MSWCVMVWHEGGVAWREAGMRVARGWRGVAWRIVAWHEGGVAWREAGMLVGVRASERTQRASWRVVAWRVRLACLWARTLERGCSWRRGVA